MPLDRVADRKALQLISRTQSPTSDRRDIFWLRVESQDDGASLDDLDAIDAEMLEELRAVLEELEAIAADLAPEEPEPA